MVGALLGAAVGSVAGASGRWLLVSVIAGAGAAVGVSLGWHADRRRKRDQAVLLGLPDVADLMALSVAAGEGVPGAIARSSRLGGGRLSTELAVVHADVRAGRSLTDALDDLARRCPSPAVTRFVDAIVVGVHRGTPMAALLRAQAEDARADAARHLIEEAARREVLMIVPVVFLILPVTVLFAVYPAVSSLTLPGI